MGLREIKKARTRILISDLARDLFVEKGYDSVTVAEIAAKAEVAVTTLFNYFPTKESIIFDREEEMNAEIVAAVRERKKDQSILDALLKYFLQCPLFNPPNKRVLSEFMKLLKSAPELASYFRGIWDRYGIHLAEEIRVQTGAPKTEADCLARLILEGVAFSCHASVPKEALNLTFKVLKKGWGK